MASLWPLLLQIPFLAGSGFLGVWYAIGMVRLVRSRRSLPTARDAISSPGARPDQPSICVIIPAHNEQRCIGQLIASLAAQQYPNVRFVLALDRCTDETAEISAMRTAGDDRFEIITITDCPPGRGGKINAICVAIERSPAAQEADILVFSDADTSWRPELLDATVNLLVSRDLQMLSLWSQLTGSSWYERIVQPAAGMELLYQHPLYRVNRAARATPFANGQFIMFRRDAYEAVGGHNAVADEIFEDLALARLARDHALRAGAFDAAGMLKVRMYETWPDFRRGWKRIFLDSANRKISRLNRYARRVWFVNTLLPLASVAGLAMALLTPVDPAWAAWPLACFHALALLIHASVLAMVYRVARFPLWTVLCSPLGAFLLAGIIREAASDLRHGRPVVWGGRSYTPQPR